MSLSGCMGVTEELSKNTMADTKENLQPMQSLVGWMLTENKFLDWILPYEGEFETEEELIAILAKINQKVNTQVNQATGVTPLLLLKKKKNTCSHDRTVKSSNLI